MKRIGASVRRLIAAAAVMSWAIPGMTYAAGAPPAGHIYVIMEENTNYEDLIGNQSDAPYINSLAQSYGFAANYYGVTHPSLPNYVAATAGDFFGSHSDDPSQVFPATNIVDQLESAGLTWSAYMQSMPSAGFTGAQYPATGSGLYVNKHNPFVLFQDVKSNAARLQRIKPADQLASDLASGKAPNFVWISPDQCHDMHGVSPSSATQYGNEPCGYPAADTTSPALIRAGDQYLKQTVTTIMSSPAWTNDSVILATWDENEFASATANRGYSSSTGCCGSPKNEGGGRVPLIAITATPQHTVSLRPYNHYSLMRTVEDNFGLPCLRHTCDASVQSMSDLLSGSGSNTLLSQTQGFSVTFTSASPGQGMVLFGPSCDALVEVATQDLSPGSTTHTVVVTGNDLPGTVGDVGLTPGATYAYEVVTATSSGQETDNNGGKCYSVTVSKQG